MKQFMHAVLAAFAVTTLAPCPAQAQTYVLTDLGAVAGAPSSAADISPTGVVTGTVTINGATIACVWTPGSGGYTFRNLGLPGGASHTIGFSVNDLAQLAATASLTPGRNNNVENAYLWTGGAWQDLTSQKAQSEGIAINASGLVVGMTFPSPKPVEATLWKSGKAYAIPNGAGGVAFGINDSGQVVGFGQPNGSGTNFVAFVWTPSVPNGTSGTTVLLPFSFAEARGINSLGDVVGVDDNVGQAFYWSHTTGAVTYMGAGVARKLNRAGQAVGSDGQRGFLWDSLNGRRSVDSLTIVGIPPGQTWAFTCPYTQLYVAKSIAQVSINDAGQICGTASVTVNGITTNHAFLLMPQ